MDIIVKLLLIFLLVLQSIVLLHVIYLTYQQQLHNKKFWEQQEEISNEVLKQLQESSIDESKCDCEKSNSDKE